MNKKYVFVKRFSLFLSVFILLFTACKENIGLGESIDTKAPSLEITYPVQKAVIMDYFYIGGNCSDDKGVKNVQVTLKKLDTVQETIGSYPAEIKNGTEWFIKFNEKNSEGLYPLKDGSYIAEVTAWDNAGQNSGTSSISFDIDNTPPVFIATNPGVTESSSRYSKYGSSFTLKGTKADEHTVASISVTVYGEDGTVKGETDQNPFVQTNISTDEVEILFARAKGYDEEKVNYARLYDMSNEHYGKEEKYSCSITLTDSAKLYQKVGDGGKEKGNSTSSIFLNDDIYESLLSPSKGFALTANSIMTVLNGTRTESFKKGSESEGAVTEITVNKIKEILEQNIKVTASEESSEKVDRLSFSLNPKANPVYKNTDELEFTSGTPKSLLAKSSINFTVELGLDKVNLLPGTFKVWIKEYDEIPSQKTLLEDRLKIEDYVYQNQSQIPLGWVKIYEADENQSSSSVACSVKVALDSSDQIKVKVGKFYSIALTGLDQEKEFVEAESLYGFTGEASGKKPEISIDTPLENNKYFASSSQIEFTGKISATEEPLSLLTASIEFLKNGETASEEKFDYSISFEDGKWQNTEYLYVDDGFNVDGSGTYHFIPSKHPDYDEKFAVKDEESGEYTFTFILKAENESQEKSLSARVDSVKPKVYLSAISPVVNGSDYKGSSDENLYVNGTIKFEGRVEETNLASDKITWKILDKTGKVLSEDYFPGKSLSFSKEINTTEFENLTEFEIVVEAEDIVGNKGSYSSTEYTASKEYPDGKFYIVDQNSDKPVVQLKNANKAIYDIENISLSENSFDCQYAKATINGTVTDDDGVEEVLVKIYDSKEGLTTVCEDQISSTTNKTTSHDFKFYIPKEEGEYWIEITARDKNFENSEKTPYSEMVEKRFCVLVDNGKPEIKCEQKISDFVNKDSLNFTVSVKDQILKSITVGISKNGEALSDTESGSYYKVDLKEKKAVITIPAELKNNGTWSFTVNAEDSLEKTSTSNFGPVVIDTETPNLTVTKKPSAYVDKNSAQIFEGTVVEETSGISEVVYWIEGTKNGESYTTVEEAASVKGTKNNAGTITNDITFKASVDISEFDENTDVQVFFKAIDNAGNYYELPSETLTLDATKPSVTFTEWDDSNPYTKETSFNLSGTVTEKNLSSLKLSVYKDDNYLSVAKEWPADEIAKLSTGNAENWKFDYDVAVDGKYSFVISAEDKAGLKDTVTSKTVYVDTTGPELFVVDNANTLTNGIYDYSKYTFTGSWSDSLSGTQTLMYSVNGNETSITDFAGQKTWRIENVALTEGANTFEFWGKDKNGNESAHVKMENVMVDFAEPVVSLTYKVDAGEATSSVPSYIADGAVLTVNGTVTESNGVKAVNVTAKKGESVINNGSNGYSVVTNPESKTFTITLTGGSESSGEWSFDVEAVDNANRTGETVSFGVNVDTQKPSITAKNDAGKEYIDRNATNKYSGKITETGGSGIKGVYWKAVKHPAEETADTSDIASWSECSVNAGFTGWNLTADLSGLEEGEGYRIFFAAQDNAGNISETKYVDQYLDNTAPKVENLTSSYGVETKKQTLKATITEKYLSELALEVTKGGVKDETQSFTYSSKDTEGKGKEWFDSYISGSEYSFEIIGDGSYVVKLTAADEAGNKTTETFESFIIDTTGPAVSVDQAGTSQIFDSRTYTFTGNWSDNLSGTKELYYSIDEGTASDAITEYAGQKKWNIEIPLTEGVHTFTFWGTDKNGNESDHVTIKDVKVDFARPVAALTYEVDGQTVQSVPSYITAGSTLKIKGTVTETNGVKSINVKAVKNGTEVTDGYTLATGSDNASFTITLEGSNASDGKWEFEISATDGADRTGDAVSTSTVVDTVKPVISVTKEPSKLFADKSVTQVYEGTITEENSGIDELLYRIKGLVNGTESETEWDSAIVKVAEGITFKVAAELAQFDENTDVKVYFKATDNAGNESDTVEKALSLDATKPVVSFTSLLQDSYTKETSISLSGTVTEKNLSSLTLNVLKDGSGSTTVKTWNSSEVDALSTGSEESWSLDYTFATDGVYYFVLTATDKAGLTGTATSKTVYIDTAGPTVTVDQSGRTAILGSEKFTFTGTWSDSLSGTRELYYSIDEGAEGEVISGAITDYAGQSKWSVEISLTEDKHTFKFWGKDNLGNTSAAVTIPDVMVDFKKPAVTSLTYKVGEKSYSSMPAYIGDNAVLTVSGTIDETNGVKSIDVTAKKGEETVTTNNCGYTLATDTTNKTFTITLAGKEASKGDWTFDVSAKDIAEQTSDKVTLSTAVDTVKPVITAANDAGKKYIDRTATNKYSGDLTETGGSGIKGVYWKAVKLSAEETADTSDIASWSECSVNAGHTGWNLTADLSGLEEGEGYRIFFAAVDNAGNISELKYVDQYLDNTAPKVEELPGSDGVGTKTLSAKITEKYLSELSLEVTKGGVKDEAQSFTYRFNDTEGDGKAWFESYVSGSEYSFTISGDGSYVVKLTATDKAGNKTTVTFASFIIDTTLPELTVISESFKNGIYDSKVYTFTGTWSDNLTGTKKLWYKINGTEKFSEDYAGQKNWKLENISLKEGENSFEFWGEDGAGNLTLPKSFNVTVDFAAPAVKTKESLPEYIAKDETKSASFSFEDSYGIKEIVCTATLNGKSVTEGFTYEPPAIYSQTAEGKISIKADSADKNGQWVFHVKAIDLAERESPEITLSTFVDSEIPLSLVSEDQNYPFCVQGKPVKDSWYSQNSLTFRGYFKENGSGIKTVFYFIHNSSSQTVPQDLTEENAAHGYFGVSDDKSVGDAVSYGITTDKFEAGINTIYIQAMDKAGNKSAVARFIVNVDMESPEFSSSFYTFDSSPQESSYYAESSGTILGNGKNNLTLFGKVSDEGSGIDRIEFYLGGKTEDCRIEDEKISVLYTVSENLTSWSDYISATYETFKNENYKNYKGWKAVIDKSKVETGSLYAFVYDRANNSVSPQILTINLDNNSPQVKISTTSNSKLVTKSYVENGDTKTENGNEETVKSINGTANFTGTASDDYTVSSITLYYSTQNSGTDYSNDTKVDVLENTSAYSWNFSQEVSKGITMLDNVEYTGEAQTVYFKFVCKDTASNESVYVYQYSVDPNADRPVFNITNLSSGAKGDAGNILKYDTVLTGTVTDDDDLESSEMKIYEVFDGKIKVSETEENSVSQINPPSTQDEWDAFEQKQNTLKYDKTTGDWSYTPLSTIDGQKQIYIYFKDSKGSSFWTGYNLQTGSSPDVVEKQNKVYMPKVQFKRNEQEIYGSTQYLSYSTDGNSPEITGFQIAIGKTQEEAENANFEDISVVYGGKEKRFAKIKITAKDANGIKNLTATLNDEDLQLTGSPTEDFSESVWYTQTVDLSSYRQESVSLVAKAWDGSGLFSNRTGTIKNDYEIPENFSIVLPKTKVENGSRITAETLTGSVEISGTANDGNGSGLKSIKWLIPAKDQTVETLVSDYTEGSSYDEYITNIETSDSKYSWTDFADYGNNSTADWKLLFNGEEGRKFLKDFCNTTEYCVTLSNYIYSIPMVFRLEDNLGNIRIVSDFKIQFNPNADWPVAKIIYPTTATGTDDEGNALITKVGGTVRVTGSATDNISVSKVYVQISTTKDDEGNIVWEKDDEALESGRTLAQSNSDSTYLEAVDLTAKNLSGLVKDSNFNVLSDGWGILASNSISWFLEINKFGELNNKTVWIRSAAVDLNESGNEFNLGLWSEPQCVAFDADVPILGKQSKSNIISVFENNAAGSSSKTLINRTYTSDMHISNKDGKWYFALSAEDTSGIKEITVKKTVGGNTAETICTAKWDARSETEGSVKEQNGVIFESHQYAIEEGNAKSYYDKLIYLPIDTSSDGYISYTVTAYEGTDTRLYSSGTYTFNIDNSSPELTPLVSEDTRITNADKLVAGNKLVNSNGSRITLSGKVTDSGTGFDKLALYFVRDEKLLNPFPQKSGAGWTSRDAKEITIESLSTAQNSQDGLHGKIIKGTINGTDNSFTASDTESLNENIRVGGLARINGVYYIIRSISDKKVTVDADIPLVSSGENNDEVFFPYAFVVQYNTSWINKEDFKDSTNYSSPVYTISEDDGDGIMQNVEKDGTTWEWSIYIPSHKIPDGKIQIYWTAFDKAGNSSSSHVDTMISNNLPRISKIFLATDLNGNGKFDNDEFAYTSVDSNGKEVKNFGYSALDINEKPQEIITSIDTDYTYLNENNEEVIGHFYVRDKLNVAMEFTSQGSQTLYVKSALGANVSLSPETGEIETEPLSDFTSLTDVKAQKYISIEKDSFKNLPGYASSMENSKDNIKSQNEKVPVKTYLQLDIWDNVNIKENSGSIATKDIIDQSTGLITEYGNQFTVLNIPFYLDIKDDNPPEISINSPVAVENAGHVELGNDAIYTAESGTFDKDDKISGKVIFTGVIQDDRKIVSVKLKSSHSINSSLITEVEVASYDENTALLKTTEAAAANDAWKFEIVTEDSAQFSKSEGHRVEWKLTLDSSFVENTAQNDVTFTLSASDALQSGNSGSTQKQVDIVPYITNIETSLSSVQKRNPSVFDRSTYGHYSVSDSETINIYGYNINGGSAVDKKGTTVVLNSAQRTSDSSIYGKTGTVYYTAAMKDFVSGPMEIKVNNVSSINNSNNNSLEQNKKPNGVNNNLLTDDVVIDVWQFNSEAAVPISGKIEQPVMKIRPTDGKIGFAFVNGPLYFSMGGSSTTEDYSYQYWMGSYDFFTSVGFTYDDAGNSWGVAAGGDINASHADKFVLMGSKWGVGGYHKDGTYHGINSKRLESIGMKGTKTNTTDTTENFDKQRIRSPSLASTVHSGYTNLYMAYYDTMNDELRFKAGRETEQTAQSYVFKVIRCDTPDSNYAGAWVEPPNNNTSLLADGDTIYLCDENGNVTDTTAYTLTGYWKDSFATTGQVAFTAKLGDLVCKPFPGTEALKYSENGNFHVFDQGENAYIKVVKSAKSFTGGSFIDYDTKPAPEAYRNGTVSIVAGDGVANYGAGEYVSLAAIPGSDVNNDKVVITWYDTNARTLYYSYNETPLTERNGTFNKADGTTGWSTPVAVFSGNEDHEYAGEYCKIAVDKNGGIHIAAYDPVNLDLVYAYASAYNASFTTCVVDSNGVVGSNLTLDVALENGRVSPYIGYYATSCIKPKIAFYTGETPAGETALVHGFTSSPKNGSSEDLFTGNWECSVVPTSKVVEMQSNQHNDINIGVWKDSSGIRKASSTGTSSVTNSPNSYDSTSNGQIWGNGTANPVLGYAVKKGSSGDTIETAQLK